MHENQGQRSYSISSAIGSKKIVKGWLHTGRNPRRTRGGGVLVFGCKSVITTSVSIFEFGYEVSVNARITFLVKPGVVVR